MIAFVPPLLIVCDTQSRAEMMEKLRNDSVDRRKVPMICWIVNLYCAQDC